MINKRHPPPVNQFASRPGPWEVNLFLPDPPGLGNPIDSSGVPAKEREGGGGESLVEKASLQYDEM